MFQLGKTIVSEDIIEKDFACNLSKCKGECCVSGVAGAPLEKDETVILKEIYPEHQLEFAGDLQYALNYEGRDLDDDEAYKHLLEKYTISENDFYTKLKSDEYKEKAYYEFALCKQLNVDSYPQVLIQLHSNKFYLITKSFSTYEEVKKGIEKALTEIKAGLN